MLQVMPDNLPKGGRGKKAPYDTAVVRVPRPCLDAVWAILDQYRETGEAPTVEDAKIDVDEVIAKAKLIYQSKMGRTKSAKASMENLLQVIYNIDVEL
jgi:hypothetical protein